jgi:hypothetical protein
MKGKTHQQNNMEVELIRILSLLSDNGWVITVTRFKAKKTESLYKFITGSFGKAQIKHYELGLVSSFGSNEFDGGNNSCISFQTFCAPEMEAEMKQGLIACTKVVMENITHAVQKANQYIDEPKLRYEDQTKPFNPINIKL